eukprot:1153862-Pelagomonas_calceolata.AAC.3
MSGSTQAREFLSGSLESYAPLSHIQLPLDVSVLLHLPFALDQCSVCRGGLMEAAFRAELTRAEQHESLDINSPGVGGWGRRHAHLIREGDDPPYSKGGHLPFRLQPSPGRA